MQNTYTQTGVKYNGPLCCLSFHQLISCSIASSGCTVVCLSLLTHLTHSCTSVNLLQIPACCGLIPSPGRYLLLLRWCVLNSPLTLAVTSVVMYWLCDQHLLPGFLILNKPELRYKLRHPFRHQKVFQQKFSFCLICR